MKRKIYKGGAYSAVVSIPREFLKTLRWRAGQLVEVVRKGRKLEIRDAKTRRRNR